MNCVLLQSYIDFEISEGNRENTRKLYERLLQRTRHVKVRCQTFHRMQAYNITSAAVPYSPPSPASVGLALAAHSTCEPSVHTILTALHYLALAPWVSVHVEVYAANSNAGVVELRQL